MRQTNKYLYQHALCSLRLKPLVKYASAIAVTGLLQACAVPDLDHAKQQISAGNTAPAQQELEQLANKGIVEAMVLLGDQLGKTEPVDAEAYYLRAVDAGVTACE